WYSGDGERPATATWWWRKACGGTRRPSGRTAFRTGAAHGSATDAGAADVGTAHVVTPHVRAANGAPHGTATHAAAYGYPSRQGTGHGNATHSAAACGQPDRPAAAIPSGARIAPADAAVGAGTVQRADADETATAGQYADQRT